MRLDRRFIMRQHTNEVVITTIIYFVCALYSDYRNIIGNCSLELVYRLTFGSKCVLSYVFRGTVIEFLVGKTCKKQKDGERTTPKNRGVVTNSSYSLTS